MGEIIIPDTVTTIGFNSFFGCSNLTSINIPNKVTSISSRVFERCTSLTNIISLATTAPTIDYDTFHNINNDGTLTIPTGSTGYDTWMSSE